MDTGKNSGSKTYWAMIDEFDEIEARHWFKLGTRGSRQVREDMALKAYHDTYERTMDLEAAAQAFFKSFETTRTMKFRDCRVHIDASLLGFKFKDAVYVTVRYATEDKERKANIYEVVLAPTILQAIKDTAKLMQELQVAANHNAQVYWKGQEIPRYPYLNNHKNN
jgi:hypothetical protein